MKLGRILGIVVALGLIAGMAVGAASSGAWFKKTDMSLDGTVTTGSFELGVGGGPFSATNLEPGDDEYTSVGTFWVENQGDYEMKWRGRVIITSDSKDLSSHLLVKCVMNPTGLVGDYGPSPDFLLWEDVAFDDLTVVNNQHIKLAPSTVTPGDPGLMPDWWAGYELFVKLDSAANNDQLDAELTADLYLEATQWINTGWSQ